MNALLGKARHKSQGNQPLQTGEIQGDWTPKPPDLKMGNGKCQAPDRKQATRRKLQVEKLGS